MPTRLVHLVVDAAEPARLARFWAGALGWEVAAEEPDEVDVWPPGFSYPDPSALPLVFVPVPEPKNGKNRLHLNLATESARHQAAEVKRLLSLGAVPGLASLPTTSPMPAARIAAIGGGSWRRVKLATGSSTARTPAAASAPSPEALTISR